MSLLLPRRAFLQSLLVGATSGAAAARPLRPKAEAPSAPFLLEGGRILVEVAFTKPDGAARKALSFFNMGAGRTILSQTLFAELGIDSGRPLRYAMANAEFETGAETVDAEKADFTGLSLEQMFAPRKVDAILSPSLLRDRLIVIDYGRRRLTVATPGTLEPEGVHTPVDLNAQTGLVTIDVDVAGGRDAFVIDAGSGYCWMRGERLKQWLAAAPDWRRAEGAVGRANYNMIDFAFEKQGTVARLPEFAIGEVVLPNVGVLGTGPVLGSFGDSLFGEVFWDNWQKSAPRPIIGWLGANVLRHFKLTIDYPNRMSYWRQQSFSDPHDLDQPGVTLMRRDGRYFISGLVRPARGAQQEDVQIGDELIAIGALNTREAGKEAVLAALHGRPGESRTLLLSGASKRKVDAPVIDLS